MSRSRTESKTHLKLFWFCVFLFFVDCVLRHDQATVDVLSQVLDYIGLLLPIWVLLALRFLYKVLVTDCNVI
jgi:hypothetical protein